MTEYFIKELAESDWLQYKAIRLRSLQDSPDSFGSTYERESAFQTEQWISRLKVPPSARDAVMLVAVVGGKYVGLVSCVTKCSAAHSATLYQMWVAPEYRKDGIGRALLEEACRWSIGQNVSHLSLSVSTTNVAAISLYSSIGFEPTGEVELLRPGSDIESQTMEALLDIEDS